MDQIISNITTLLAVFGFDNYKIDNPITNCDTL